MIHKADILGTILDIDRQLLLYINGRGSVFWDSFWATLTRETTPIPLYVFVLFMCIKYFGLRKTLWLLLVAAILITISDQTCNLFKNSLVKRPRPCHDQQIAQYVRLVDNYCGGIYGFFSAHAANSFAFAVFFSLAFRKVLPWLTYILVVWAGFTAYSRVYLGVHYPSDILAGALSGTLLAFFAWRIFKRISKI